MLDSLEGEIMRPMENANQLAMVTATRNLSVHNSKRTSSHENGILAYVSHRSATESPAFRAPVSTMMPGPT